jgi:hypothetical protein
MLFVSHTLDDRMVGGKGHNLGDFKVSSRATRKPRHRIKDLA